MKGVVLREVELKGVGAALAYRFAVYPSASPFFEGHYFGKAFRWVVDVESVVIGLGPCVYYVRLELRRRRIKSGCG